MSEFNLAAYDQQHNLTQRNVHAQPEVEWVSTTGASSSYGGAYNYGSSNNLAAQYGTFEEEPPLLEGVLQGVGCLFRFNILLITLTHRHRAGYRHSQNHAQNTIRPHLSTQQERPGRSRPWGTLGVCCHPRRRTFTGVCGLGDVLSLETEKQALVDLLLLPHTQTAKFNFGVLLGWSAVCSITIWFVVSSMAGPEAANKGAVDLYSCMCLLGYGMLPMVLYAVVSLLIPRYA